MNETIHSESRPQIDPWFVCCRLNRIEGLCYSGRFIGYDLNLNATRPISNRFHQSIIVEVPVV